MLQGVNAENDSAGRQSVTLPQIGVAVGVLLVVIVIGYLLVFRALTPSVAKATAHEMPVVQEEFQGAADPAPNTAAIPGRLTHDDELRQEKLEMLKHSADSSR